MEVAAPSTDATSAVVRPHNRIRRHRFNSLGERGRGWRSAPHAKLTGAVSETALFFLFSFLAFLFSISVHESAHALVADRCGDPTARLLGRISLNPIRHIEIFGTVVLPLITFFSGLPTFGWAKAYGGVGVESFLKSMTVQSLTERGLRSLGTTLERLAAMEGLQAHGRSVSLRLGRAEKKP